MRISTRDFVSAVLRAHRQGWDERNGCPQEVEDSPEDLEVLRLQDEVRGLRYENGCIKQRIEPLEKRNAELESASRDFDRELALQVRVKEAPLLEQVELMKAQLHRMRELVVGCGFLSTEFFDQEILKVRVKPEVQP